jgi:hypothetical protein
MAFGFILMALALGTSSAFAASPPPVLVDTCGQVVPEKAAAYLAADLDCSAYAGTYAIELEKRASLDLGGFTLTIGANYGIGCYEGKCAIRNGTVTGSGLYGVVGTKVLVENVTVATSGLLATSLNENSTLRGSTIAGTSTVGVHASGGKKKLSIVDSTITGQRRLGVWVYKVDLRNSTVTGNGTDPECAGDATCADLFTARRPKLRDSTCGSSAVQGADPTPGCLGWCVCAGD